MIWTAQMVAENVIESRWIHHYFLRNENCVHGGNLHIDNSEDKFTNNVSSV